MAGASCLTLQPFDSQKPPCLHLGVLLLEPGEIAVVLSPETFWAIRNGLERFATPLWNRVMVGRIENLHSFVIGRRKMLLENPVKESIDRVVPLGSIG